MMSEGWFGGFLFFVGFWGVFFGFVRLVGRGWVCLGFLSSVLFPPTPPLVINLTEEFTLEMRKKKINH